jgi:hypothetical protein
VERYEWIEQLLFRYAELGLQQWIDEDNDDLKRRADTVLDGRIVDSLSGIRDTIADIYAFRLCDEPLLIPTPKPKDRDQVEQGFFLPLYESRDNQGPTLSFDLFLIVKGRNCLAYRWEPADNPDGTHGYGHVQMCTALVKGNLSISGVPEWIPDSYPAIPLLTSDPLGIFLAMTTSLHGLNLGILDLIDVMMTNEPLLRTKYKDHVIQHFLNT